MVTGMLAFLDLVGTLASIDLGTVSWIQTEPILIPGGVYCMERLVHLSGWELKFEIEVIRSS